MKVGAFIAYAALVGTAGACAHVAAGGDMRLTSQEIRDRLGPALSCEWKEDRGHLTCLSKSDERGPLFLTLGADDHLLETAEVALVIEGKDASAREAAIGDAAALMRVLLPEWKEGPNWYRRSVSDLSTGITGVRNRRTVVGRVTVMTQVIQPSDLPGRYVDLVITRSPHVEKWEYSAQ